MQTNNKYWNKPLEELKIHCESEILLFRYAINRNNWEAARRHENELSLIMDAISANERGELND
ncbi:hypothetical protein [Bacillus andreraoultii]|uniref:hypothetical protein n=1 Tax=Bacillus andreraoultii TaxID=1499685 RepID=UPI00053A706C|nr:hypothetical protein [Bacillus andreraoultii]